MIKEYIKTKEDFKDKYIELPNNLSKKKFDKIKAKFKRLGFDICHLRYSDIEDTYYSYGFNIFVYVQEKYDGLHLYKGSIGNWRKGNKSQEISIKDFLAEPKEKDNAYLTIVEIKESKKGIYVKGKIKNYNPHLKIAGIEIPYYPVCPNEEEDTYIIEVDGIKIIVPNEYSSIRHMATVMDGCCISDVCPCCGKNTIIQVSKGDRWVCPYCLDGEQKEEKLRTFNSPEEAIKWIHDNPMKEIEYEAESYEGYDCTYKERFNPNIGALGLEKYFEIKVEGDGWIFDEQCLAKNFKNVAWRSIREYKDADNILELDGTLDMECNDKKEDDIWKEFLNGIEALDWCIKNPMSVVSYLYEDDDKKEYVRYNDELRTFQTKRLEDTEWKHLYKYCSNYGDVMIELLHRWKNIFINVIVCPDYAEY